MIKQPPIITTDKWGARPPKSPPVWAGRPQRIIFHHTAGHHPNLDRAPGESRAESIADARAIQNFHMGQGWNDSGHNFLVCRNGLILVGRQKSYTAIRKGRMIVSAHCPGQNTQPGIEHEHFGKEAMTKAQFHASAWLHAWIISVCKMRGATAIHMHKEYFPTACPAELAAELPALKAAVSQMLRQGTPGI
jgi:hypothetical protein